MVVGSKVRDTRQHGFVTFTDLRAATIARQVVHDSHVLDFHLLVTEAPAPEDIYWRNVGATMEERKVRFG